MNNETFNVVAICELKPQTPNDLIKSSKMLEDLIFGSSDIKKLIGSFSSKDSAIDYVYEFFKTEKVSDYIKYIEILDSDNKLCAHANILYSVSDEASVFWSNGYKILTDFYQESFEKHLQMAQCNDSDDNELDVYSSFSCAYYYQAMLRMGDNQQLLSS